MDELMSVYTQEDGDQLVGVLYQNRWGAFARVDQRWVAMRPRDPRFDGLAVYDVRPEHNSEALAAFDAGGALLQDVQGLLAVEAAR